TDSVRSWDIATSLAGLGSAARVPVARTAPGIEGSSSGWSRAVRTWRLLAVAALWMLALTGCGGDDGEPTSASTATEPAAQLDSTATATEAPPESTATATVTPEPAATATPTVEPMPTTLPSPTATEAPTATPEPVQQLIYVADTLNHRITVFDGQSWSLVPGQGGQGTEPGQFDFPCSVIVDSRGWIYVTDSNNHRIQRFDGEKWDVIADGFGVEGAGQFSLTYGIAVDPDDNVWVADSNNARL